MAPTETVPAADGRIAARERTRLRVLIAGLEGGIGRACSERLEAEGHLVVGVDRPMIDITRPGGAEEAVARAEAELGGLDGIVHAVGMSGRRLGDGLVSECTDKAWAEVMRVNVESLFRLMRAGLPKLAEGGSFVTVGSVLADSADRDFLTAAYMTSKSAMRGLVRAAAMEFAPRGVRVNIVSAGLVDTPMSTRANSSPRIVERLKDLQPLGGAAVSADDVAGAVLWLLTPASGRTTGAAIPVDGGWLLR